MFFRISLILFFILLIVNLGFAQEDKTIPTLSYDELIAKQADYAGKLVRVTGYWHNFFEVSALHDSPDISYRNFREKAAWVEFEGNDKLCREGKKIRKLGKKYIGAAAVVFVGRLHVGGGFGHLNDYQYQFDVSCVEQIKKLPKDHGQ